MEKKLSIFLIMLLLNFYDLLSTYILTPDLKLEGNFVVANLNGGWISLIFICIFWQLIYYKLILLGYDNIIFCEANSKKFFFFKFLIYIFPAYIVMKFLVGSDNLISHFCSTFLHKYATLNSVIKNHYDWNINTQDIIWKTNKGRFVFWFAFINPLYKQIFIYLMTLAVLFSFLFKEILSKK